MHEWEVDIDGITVEFYGDNKQVLISTSEGFVYETPKPIFYESATRKIVTFEIPKGDKYEFTICGGYPTENEYKFEVTKISEEEDRVKVFRLVK